MSNKVHISDAVSLDKQVSVRTCFMHLVKLSFTVSSPCHPAALSFLHVLAEAGMSKRLTAFHLHIEIPQEVLVFFSTLMKFYCCSVFTKTHQLVQVGCLLWFGLVKPLTLRENYLCAHVFLGVHVCRLYVNVWGGGDTSFELRALSRDKLLWHHKATWSISRFSWCQEHFMWWWFDAWVLGLFLPRSDWAMIVGAGICGITELLGFILPVTTSHPEKKNLDLRCSNNK